MSDDIYAQLAAASRTQEATDARRTTVICTFRIGSGFEHWKAGYERAVGSDAEILGWRIWRGQDDADLVIVEEVHASRAHAQTMFDHPATREAMQRDGI